MSKIIFFKGIDDTNSATIFKVNTAKATSYRVNLIGMTPLDVLFKKHPELNSCKIDFIIGINKLLHLNGPASEYVIFNQVGSADACSTSLKTLKSIIQKNQFKEVINKPENVELTSRDILPNTLSNIDGIVTAKVNTYKVSNLKELKGYINKYPVIIRKKGFHNGDFCQLINSVNELTLVESFIQGPTEIHAIEYINTLDKSLNLYKKARIAVINGNFYPQHLLFSDEWMVHSRRKIMVDQLPLRQLENDFLNTFDVFMEKHKTKLLEVHKRIGLDYYGIDCIEDDKGNLIIFEANSCMDLLSAWYGDNNEFIYKKPFRKKAINALKQLIQDSLSKYSHMIH